MTAWHCATAARARNDPLPGSAAPAHRWLLLEYPGPWATKALQSHHLAGAPALRLDAAARASSGRVLLIRRPGRRPPSANRPLAWAVVDHGGSQHWGTWQPGDDLTAAAAALAEIPAASGPQSPVLLVCTHGVHDLCCAVRGRPVARDLAQRWPEATWECSHLGGDRFAANVLVLPDGACYGNLSATSAVAVVGAHLAGQVTPSHLRGLSTETPAAQAAIVAAHARYGPGGPRDLTSAQERRVDASTWAVSLTGRGDLPGRIEATVVRRRRPEHQLTCRAAGPSAAYEYGVERLVARP